MNEHQPTNAELQKENADLKIETAALKKRIEALEAESLKIRDTLEDMSNRISRAQHAADLH